MNWRRALLIVPDSPEVMIERVKVSAEEIDAETAKRHHRKLRRARAYLRLKKIGIRPLYHATPKGPQ